MNSCCMEREESKNNEQYHTWYNGVASIGKQETVNGEISLEIEGSQLIVNAYKLQDKQ